MLNYLSTNYWLYVILWSENNIGVQFITNNNGTKSELTMLPVGKPIDTRNSHDYGDRYPSYGQRDNRRNYSPQHYRGTHYRNQKN